MEQQGDIKRMSDRGLPPIETVGAALERTFRAVFGVLRDVRGEVTHRVLSVVDGVEAMQQGVAGVARSIVRRADEVANVWIDADEQLVLGALRAVFTTGSGATRPASRAAASVMAARRDGAMEAQA